MARDRKRRWIDRGDREPRPGEELEQPAQDDEAGDAAEPGDGGRGPLAGGLATGAAAGAGAGATGWRAFDGGGGAGDPGSAGQALAGGAGGQGLTGGSGGQGVTGGAGTPGAEALSPWSGGGPAGGAPAGEGVAGGVTGQGLTGSTGAQGLTGGAGGQGLTGGSAGSPAPDAGVIGGAGDVPGGSSGPDGPGAATDTPGMGDPAGPAHGGGGTGPVPGGGPDALPGTREPAAGPSSGPDPVIEVPDSGARTPRPLRTWAVPAGLVALLVILGAVIIDRGGSDESGDDAVAATGQEPEAGPGSGPAPDGDSSGAPTVDQWDLCQLLTQTVAEEAAGMVMEPQEAVMYTPDQRCWYGSIGEANEGFEVRVSLDTTGDTIYHCGSTADSCGTIDEPVPSLPDGMVSWYEMSPEVFHDTTPRGMWIRWTAEGRQWALWYSDLRGPDERTPALDRKDALIAAAEQLHDMIVDGVGRP